MNARVELWCVYMIGFFLVDLRGPYVVRWRNLRKRNKPYRLRYATQVEVKPWKLLLELTKCPALIIFWAQGREKGPNGLLGTDQLLRFTWEPRYRFVFLFKNSFERLMTLYSFRAKSTYEPFSTAVETFRCCVLETWIKSIRCLFNFILFISSKWT